MSNIINVLKDVKEKSRKRKFVQTIDVAINLQQIDLKRPENRFTEEIVLPCGRGKEVSVGVIGDNLVIKSKGIANELIDNKRLSKIEKDKKELKKLVEKCDFFVTEAPFMARVGKSLGKVLGPRGKMPKPLPPQADPAPLIKKLKGSVRIAVKENACVHFVIGTESMKDEELNKNFDVVMGALEKRQPNGKNNIRSVYLKSTMGPSVSVKY